MIGRIEYGSHGQRSLIMGYVAERLLVAFYPNLREHNDSSGVNH